MRGVGVNIVTLGSGNTDDIDAIDKAKRGQRGRSMLVSGTREDENVTWYYLSKMWSSRHFLLRKRLRSRAPSYSSFDRVASGTRANAPRC
jgi:hypothetical protein